MNAEFQDFPQILWPAPPFFRFAESPPAPLCACVIEFNDGRVVEGLLVEFDPGNDTICLWPNEGNGPGPVSMAEVRCLRLTQASGCIADAAALTAIGGSAASQDHRRDFVVKFCDGTTMSGSTLGFLKETVGLFLYVADSDSLTIVNCFIPAKSIQDLQVGAPLGEMLVERENVKPETLSLALNQQTVMRQDRIGQYLAQRAIISTEELVRALHEQGTRPNARLGDILVEAGAITPKQLDEALAIQAQHRGRRIGDILVDIGAVSVRMIQVALSDKLGIPYVNVREFPIGLSALENISTAFAIRHQALPLLQTANSLIVAVENPLAADFLQDLRFQTTLSVDPVIADPQELKERISKEYSGLEGRLAAAKATALSSETSSGNGQLQHINPFQANVADLTSQLARESKTTQRTVKEVITDPRVTENTLVRLVNKIIIEAHAQGASDIHVESNGGSASTRIRFRKDGDLEDYLELPQTYSNSLVSRIKIMAELDISERRHPQDGKIDFAKHGPLPIELRVAIIPTANGLEDVVLRILSAAEALPLDQVGFEQRDLLALRKMLSRSFGLILVCGPTGSGKTTTLHSLLRDINRPDLKIWTAEDPVEITQRGLRQVQVNAKIDWTFAAAMRAFLRADPDVIMVGEMRDGETTKIGIEASLTGHLVFSTLHTNSAVESIVRLLDLGMDPFNFADALIGILSQRLSRKLCPSCKRTRPATEEEIRDLTEEYCSNTSMDPADVRRRWQAAYGTEGRLLLREAVGCDACREGYKGRVVVYELLTATAEIKHLVRSKSTVPQLVSMASQEGMVTLRQNAIQHVLRGTLDLAAARAVSS
jgi:type II secretory ATPase GspE/PulE/Tfp pilus assembly ATPase PilB-like protein